MEAFFLARTVAISMRLLSPPERLESASLLIYSLEQRPTSPSREHTLSLGSFSSAESSGRSKNRKTLEADRLLKCVCDALFGTVGDAEFGDVLTVEKYFALRGSVQTCDDLCQRCLSASVRDLLQQ